jgi:hypothetical protein
VIYMIVFPDGGSYEGFRRPYSQPKQLEAHACHSQICELSRQCKLQL